MISTSWDFLNNLDKSEMTLLSSAMELSGLPDDHLAEGLSAFLSGLTGITGCRDYTSLLQWSNSDNSEKTIPVFTTDYYSIFYR